MSETLEQLILKTQETLQPLIAKPKLADKLLAKPPFRFLHDIFTALQASTGFPAGLYNDFEANSANVKEKNQKTTFLEKMIVCVGLLLNKEVLCRASKVVAGLDPENTNLFLQDIASIAKNPSLNWASAIKKTLEKVPSLNPSDGEPMVVSETKEAVSNSNHRSTAKESKALEVTPVPETKERQGIVDAENAAARPRHSQEKASEKTRNKEEKLRASEGNENVESIESAESKTPITQPTAVEEKRTVNTRNTGDSAPIDISGCNGDFERTKVAIEAIISKPKMSVKLLSKPPFRFLHDLISEVTRVTGFAEGLYTAEELDSSNIKEKGPKIDYLTKIIQCVSTHLGGVDIEAKPAKIVAGLEPEATNVFLQMLVIASQCGRDNSRTVQLVLHGPGNEAEKPIPAADTIKSIPDSEKKQPPIGAKATPPSSRTSSREKKSNRSEGSATNTLNDDGLNVGTFGTAQAKVESHSVTSMEDKVEKKSVKPSNDNDETAFEGLMSSNAPGTSDGNSMGTSRTARATTARRRPPKLKENVTEVGRMMVNHDANAAPVIGIMKDGDNADTDEEDGDNNSVASQRKGGNNLTAENTSEATANLLLGDGGHGKLVRDILKDQAEEKDDQGKQGPSTEDAMGDKKEDGGGITGIRLGKRRKSVGTKNSTIASGTSGAGTGVKDAAVTSAAELKDLRDQIQKICQATNPLGKGVEFVGENLELMGKELVKWKKEIVSKKDLYEEEKKRTMEELQPLKNQLVEIEEQIKEQIHKINSLKATIAKNEEKTNKLLRMVVSA